MDEGLISEAKRYAENHDTSLSRLIARYLLSLTGSQNVRKVSVSPMVQEILGILPRPRKFQDQGKDYRRHLIKKYK